MCGFSLMKALCNCGRDACITPSVFNMKVMFGHKLRSEIKVKFGETSLKLRQTKWNVARNNVNVV
jgi:hypothetical protein